MHERADAEDHDPFVLLGTVPELTGHDAGSEDDGGQISDHHYKSPSRD